MQVEVAIAVLIRLIDNLLSGEHTGKKHLTLWSYFAWLRHYGNQIDACVGHAWRCGDFVDESYNLGSSDTILRLEERYKMEISWSYVYPSIKIMTQGVCLQLSQHGKLLYRKQPVGKSPLRKQPYGNLLHGKQLYGKSLYEEQSHGKPSTLNPCMHNHLIICLICSNSFELCLQKVGAHSPHKRCWKSKETKKQLPLWKLGGGFSLTSSV